MEPLDGALQVRLAVQLREYLALRMVAILQNREAPVNVGRRQFNASQRFDAVAPLLIGVGMTVAFFIAGSSKMRGASFSNLPGVLPRAHGANRADSMLGKPEYFHSYYREGPVRANG